jgi:hypothetical protein
LRLRGLHSPIGRVRGVRHGVDAGIDRGLSARTTTARAGPDRRITSASSSPAPSHRVSARWRVSGLSNGISRKRAGAAAASGSMCRRAAQRGGSLVGQGSSGQMLGFVPRQIATSSSTNATTSAPITSRTASANARATPARRLAGRRRTTWPADFLVAQPGDGNHIVVAPLRVLERVLELVCKLTRYPQRCAVNTGPCGVQRIYYAQWNVRRQRPRAASTSRLPERRPRTKPPSGSRSQLAPVRAFDGTRRLRTRVLRHYAKGRRVGRLSE